ncbi:MAG: hypothetical protein OEZ02_08490, partial [Anaerolineae bacterium]|nr:hypothetical protein [Anaerolineae bacterium]
DHVGLKQAVQALETGRKAEAQTMLAHIVKDEPDNEMAWLWLAVSLDEPQKKRFALDRALAINPKSKMGLKIKQSLDKPAAAQAPNQVAASHPAMQIRRAANALETGQQAQAQTILAAIVKQDARNEHAWLWLAASLDDLEKKRVCVQKALAINPQSEAGQRMIQALAKPIIPPLPPLPAQPAAKPAAPPARRAQPDTMWTRYKALFKRKFFPRVIIFIILVIIVNVCNWLSSLLEG